MSHHFLHKCCNFNKRRKTAKTCESQFFKGRFCDSPECEGRFCESLVWKGRFCPSREIKQHLRIFNKVHIEWANACIVPGPNGDLNHVECEKVIIWGYEQHRVARSFEKTQKYKCCLKPHVSHPTCPQLTNAVVDRATTGNDGAGALQCASANTGDLSVTRALTVNAPEIAEAIPLGYKDVEIVQSTHPFPKTGWRSTLDAMHVRPTPHSCTAT